MNFPKTNPCILPAAWSAVLLSLLLSACGDDPQVLLRSAKDYLAKSDNKAAVIQLKNVLQTDPDLPEARFLMGSALLESGDPIGAETELRKALTLKHPQDSVAPQLARALLAQGQAKKLTNEFAQMELGTGTARASLQMSLAAAYAMQDNAERSQAALNAALQAEPGYAPALVEQARQKAEQGDPDGALAMAEAVIARTPNSHEAWKLKGDLLWQARLELAEALAAYRKAVEIKPDFLIGHAAVITLLLQQGNLVEATTQIAQLKKFAPHHLHTTYLEGQLALQNKDYKLARDLAQEVLKVSPTNIQGLQLAGTAEFQLDSLLAAEDYLSRVVHAAPKLALARRLLVVTYLRTGQPAKAMAALLPGLKRETIDPELLSVAGEVYLQAGDVSKAQEYFRKAAQQAPKDARKRTSLAVTHFLTGSAEVAFAELQDIAGSDKGTTADLALISAHLRRHEFDKALKAIDGFEKKQPDKPLAAQLRGRTLLAKRDTSAARRSFERALAINPGYFPAASSLAAMDLADKKPDDARKRFEALLAKDPKSAQAWLALAELAARSGSANDEIAKLMGNAVSAKPADVATRVLLIDFHLRSKDAKAAVSAAQNAATAIPGSPEILDALGRAQQAAGDLNQAMAAYNKLAGMQPLSAQPHVRLAGVHMAEKNTQAAAQSLRKALEIKLDLLEAQRALIALELAGKRLQEALAIAHTVQKQRPKEAAGYVLEGDISVSQKNWDDALAAYRGGLKHVNSSELALKQHSVLLAAGKNAEADRFATAWQKDHPKDTAFLFYLGDGAIARKSYGDAEKHYAAVIKLQPNNAMAYNNLAWVSAKLNKNEAIAYAEKANTLAPGQPAFMDTLAMLLADKGSYAQAVELEIKALALQPLNAVLKLNLAKIHLKGGQKDLARKQLDELAGLGDKFPAQAEVAMLRTSL